MEKNDTNVHWTLAPNDANYIMRLLDARPHSEVRRLIDNLVQQVRDEAAPPANPPEPNTHRRTNSGEQEPLNLDA